MAFCPCLEVPAGSPGEPPQDGRGVTPKPRRRDWACAPEKTRKGAHEGSVLRHIRGLSGEHARRAPCTAQQVQKAGQRRLPRKGEEAREDRHRSKTLCDSA